MENTYIISYDLKKADDEDYENLYQAIKAYGTWAHITESTWAVKTSDSAKKIRDDFERNNTSKKWSICNQIRKYCRLEECSM